jgi:hypothetical protein
MQPVAVVLDHGAGHPAVAALDHVLGAAFDETGNDLRIEVQP